MMKSFCEDSDLTCQRFCCCVRSSRVTTSTESINSRCQSRQLLHSDSLSVSCFRPWNRRPHSGTPPQGPPCQRLKYHHGCLVQRVSKTQMKGRWFLFERRKQEQYECWESLTACPACCLRPVCPDCSLRKYH